VFTTQETAASATGSDADAAGASNDITLVAGEFNPDIDAGIIQNKASLGDFVWIDANKDGLQDATELPLEGVVVNLYKASAPNTIFASIPTNAKGFYWFGGLDADDYIVEFAPVATYSRTIPTGQIGGIATGETLLFNSDADATTGRTAIISLAAGERNPNIDAGYFVSPLPVKLLYVKANADGCTVRVSWATASEQNAKSFEVWRSTDGIRYTKIGEVRAAGNSNTAQYYTFDDAKPLRTNYYKLVQTDFDGRSETFNLASKVTTNGCYEENNNGISGLFPNPNGTSEVTVKFYTDRSDSEAVTFVITDVVGRTVATFEQTVTRGANVVNLDISALPSGTYLVKVQGNGWYSLAQKLVRINE
jgi:hypothetical protein